MRKKNKIGGITIADITQYHNAIVIKTSEYYIAERKKELLPFARAWRELESFIVSEISQVVRDKYHIGNMINKRKRQTKYNQRH